MVKLMGAAMIILSSGALGGFVYRTLKNRCDSLRGLIGAVDIFQAEVVFRRADLEEALERVVKGTRGCINRFFAAVHDKMGENTPFNRAFDSNLDQLAKSGLTKMDMEIFGDITGVLGRFDSFEQAQMLKTLRQSLAVQYEESKVELGQKGKLYRALGLSFGIMLALIVV